MSHIINPPNSDEYAPYAANYINMAAVRGDILVSMIKQIDEIKSTLGSLNAEQLQFKYEPTKWSIIEVFGHIIDVERILSTRLFRISRNDPAPNPGFDHDLYVTEGRYSKCNLSDLIQEFEYLRRSNEIMISNLTETALGREGIARDVKITVRAIVFMLVGHIDHHLNIIKDKYLLGVK